MIGNRGHSWTWKVCNWFCCTHCGLVPRFDKDGTHICNRQEP